MRLIAETRIAGAFRGYRGGRVYILADASRWRQEDRTEEYLCRRSPRCRLLKDGTGRTFLDVDGMSGAAVWVVRADGRPTERRAAY